MAIQKVSDLPILRQSSQDFDYNKVKPSLIEISYKISSDDVEGVSRYQSMAVTVAELANYMLSSQTAGDVVDLTLSGDVFLNRYTNNDIAQTYRVLAKTGNVDISAFDHYKLFSPNIELSCSSFTVKSAGSTPITVQDQAIEVAASTTFTQPVYVPAINKFSPDNAAVNLKYLKDAIPNIESPFILFETKYLDYNLSSSKNWVNTVTAGWLLSSDYPNAFDHLRQDWNDGEDIEIVYAKSNNTKIKARRAPDGHVICSSDVSAKVDNLFNAVGVAWIYGIDGAPANPIFRLPRNSQFVKGCRTSADIGEYQPPTIPAHTHSVPYYLHKCDCAAAGGIKNSPHSDGGTAYQDTSTTTYAGGIVGNTVSPPAMPMYLYMYCS